MTTTRTTTRPVCFAALDRTTLVTHTHTYPAGTTVYATERRDGTFTIRIPGTLFEQSVDVTALVPA